MQIRPEAKKTMAVLAVLLTVFVGVWGMAGKSQAYELWVDGKLVGYVSDQAQVNQTVASIVTAQNQDGCEAACMSKVEFVKADKPSKPLMAKVELENALRETLALGQKACVVQVNGKDAVALATKQMAEQAVSDIRSAYEANTKRLGNVDLTELKFNEEITFVEKAVEPVSVKGLDDAKAILLRGTDQIVSYSVKNGDSLWGIARANNLLVDDLRKANPDMRGDRLDIGQKLNLAVAQPFVTLVSIERQTLSLAIPFRTEVREDPDLWPWQSIVKSPGVPGKKTVVVEIRRDAGKEIARTVLSETLHSEPVTQLMVQGSKMSPDLGTGQYAWPTSGKITSRFGQRRGGYHQGLDIAAPIGTPVYAADSGTVVWSAVYAGYGLLIKIDHGGGKTITMYGHLSQSFVSVGQTVKRGQLIGKVGSSGRSTGPHLHFEIRVEGSALNPFSYYPGAH